jgi:hypothetical protein
MITAYSRTRGGTIKVQSFFTLINITEPKTMLNYSPNERRRLGKPLERLSDEAETGR